MEKEKVLVVYFSATGTTEQVAKQIAKIADADICEITPAKPYSSADLDWTNKQSRSSVEMNNPKARPEIKALLVDVPVVAATRFEGDIGNRNLLAGNTCQITVALEIFCIGSVGIANGENHLLLKSNLGIISRCLFRPYLLS